MIVTAGIIIQLAGIGITGAMSNALTGYPLTASARLLDALLSTTGVIAWVAAGLLAAAGATAIALAAGVILGQYVARPIRWEGHWSGSPPTTHD